MQYYQKKLLHSLCKHFNYKVFLNVFKGYGHILLPSGFAVVSLFKCVLVLRVTGMNLL